ncbi:MAG: hypothetical protein ACYTFW_26050, partial [Planctomycetota bacterium]
MVKFTVRWIRMANGSKNYAKFMPEDTAHVDNFEKAMYVRKSSPLARAKVILVTMEISELELPEVVVSRLCPECSSEMHKDGSLWV